MGWVVRDDKLQGRDLLDNVKCSYIVFFLPYKTNCVMKFDTIIASFLLMTHLTGEL
jgi:hypothetical protein